MATEKEKRAAEKVARKAVKAERLAVKAAARKPVPVVSIAAAVATPAPAVVEEPPKSPEAESKVSRETKGNPFQQFLARKKASKGGGGKPRAPRIAVAGSRAVNRAEAKRAKGAIRRGVVRSAPRVVKRSKRAS